MTPPAASAARRDHGRSRGAAGAGRAAAAPAARGGSRAGDALRGVAARRLSGPLRPQPAGARAGAAALPGGRLVPVPPLARVGRAVRGLPDGRLVDRLLRGRFWIGLIGFLLIGIVAMQVSLLKLNAGIGRAVESTQTLERKNELLRSSISRLSAGDRVAAEAARLGLVMPPPDRQHYRDALGDRDARRALRTMRAPAPTTSTTSTTSTTAASVTPAAPDPAAAAAPPATDGAAGTDTATAPGPGGQPQPQDQVPAQDPAAAPGTGGQAPAAGQQPAAAAPAPVAGQGGTDQSGAAAAPTGGAGGG